MADSATRPQPDASERRRGDRLDSWKEIAAYLKRDTRTVQRWEKTEGLPVHRHLHEKLGTIYAFKSEIDTWFSQREATLEKQPPEVEGALEVPKTELAQPPRGKRVTTALLALVAPLVAAFLVAAGTYVAKDKIWPHPKDKVILAVLPFKNLGADPEQQYFAAGLTEEMIARLGRLHPQHLGVIALTGAYAAKPVDQIGKEFGADYLLGGSVRLASNRVAITADLVQIKDRTHVWADSYERDLHDILAIQNEVAGAIADQVMSQVPRNIAGEPQPLRAEKSAQVSSPRDTNPEAYTAYLKGRFFLNKRTPADLQRAVQYFEEAIAKEPNYAGPYAGLAECYGLLGSVPYTALPPSEAFPKAEKAAQKAIELDESVPEAHVALGYARLVYDWDRSGAEQHFKRALQLQPGYAAAHQFYAYYLSAVGRLDEAIAERKKAVELDPLSPVISSSLGEAYYLARQFDLTIEQNRKSLELDPNFIVALLNIGRAYEQKGMHEQAREAYLKGLALAPDDPAMLMLLGHQYGVSGDSASAQRILDRLQQLAKQRYVPSFYIAGVYAGLGDNGPTLEWLEKAFNERCDYLVYLQYEPAADGLRRDPRYPEVLRRVRFAP